MSLSTKSTETLRQRLATLKHEIAATIRKAADLEDEHHRIRIELARRTPHEILETPRS